MSRLWVLLAAAALDWLLGDPAWMPHPIRLMGLTISRLETGLRRLFPRTPGGELLAGGVLVLTMVLLFGGGSLLLLAALYALSPAAGTAAEVWLSYQLLAARCLRDESMAVYRALTGRSLMDAQRAVGRIVGRDTQCLDRDGVTRAAVETVAENTSDGVIAPLFWLALGGLPLGMVYKAVNTMDSMVGYRNERYLFFGRAAARTDDAANYLPARLSALLMCLAAALLPGFRGRDALRIWRRDRRKHKSPNSAQTEAACAGALGVQLAGDASYFGTLVRKPTIGEVERPIRPEDIPTANRLMYGTEVLCLALCAAAAVLCSHIFR